MTKQVKFIKSGTSIRVSAFDPTQVVDTLPTKVYTLNLCEFTGFYLESHSDRFEVPDNIYGSAMDRVERVLHTYDDRDASTGVLLTGDKGSGKTLLMHLLANRMLETGKSVVIINQSYGGPAFMEFLANVGECVIIFDEFGKIFSGGGGGDVDHEVPVSPRGGNSGKNAAQEGLLTLFDGSDSCKRLLLLSENNVSLVSEFMLNRPGRIYYHYQFKKVEVAMVNEYCAEHNVPADVIDEIVTKRNASLEFSFDVLKAIVAEYTRYKCPITEVYEHLNVEQPFDLRKTMTVTRIVDTNDDTELFIEKHTKNCRHIEEGKINFAVYDTKKEAKKGEAYRWVSMDIKNILKKDNDTIVASCSEEGVLFYFKVNQAFSIAGYSDYLAF